MMSAGAETRDSLVPRRGEPWTPIPLTRWSGAYLEEKGIENGRLDAEIMLAHVLGLTRLDLYLQFDRPIQPGELKSFKALLLRRASREPLQYVLGSSTFRELELRLDSRALVPRPETEVLVEEVLSWARGQEGELACVDMGTGSGAIALSLLWEGPFRRVVATDASPMALELARENAALHGLLEKIEFREGFLFQPFRPGERFDALISNPPYVPTGDRDGLDPEVRDWEPHGALFAGPDGLDLLVPLVTEGHGLLRSGGLLATEVGHGQAQGIAELMERTGAYQEVRIVSDLAGRERIVLGVATGGVLEEV